MKTLLICVVFIVLWNYLGFPYGETPEERARESLRSQTESQKKSNKNTTEHQAKSMGTKDPIRPFGPFSWEDDLLTAVIKANGLPGVEKISLPLRGSIQGKEIDVDLNLKGVQNKEQLQRVLTEYLKSPILTEFCFEEECREFLDPEGNKSVYLKRPLSLDVSPVVIAGVPFTLTVALISSPGLSIAHPHKVPGAIGSFKDLKKPIQVAFPHVVQEVELSSSSPILVQKLKDIERILEDKYRKYDPDHHHIFEWRKGGVVHDPESPGLARLEVYGPTPFTLKYSSDVFVLSLNQLYAEHVAKLESKKLGNKVDLKEGL